MLLNLVGFRVVDGDVGKYEREIPHALAAYVTARMSRPGGLGIEGGWVGYR